MAGDWIKVQSATPDKPEVHAIAGELDIDADAVVGKLIRLWIWADQQTYDGNAPSVTEALLDHIMLKRGMTQALIKVGWMIEKKDGLVIPNFARHNGETAKKRALTHKRVAKHRNAPSVTKALPEKRREEKRRVIEPPAGVSLSRTSGTTTAGRTEFGFPTANGGTWYLSTIKYEQYADTYADLDLDLELQKARQWLRDNKQRRKTPGGMTAFLTKWLNRCTDAAGPGGDRGTNRKVGSGL